MQQFKTGVESMDAFAVSHQQISLGMELAVESLEHLAFAASSK